ncbi:hypothetical protein [Acinetobacter sp.]|uniref:hypothetical protein n=1 Tax=Acinetobacter sp. TaxID=472 RepID=UPI0035B3917F
MEFALYAVNFSVLKQGFIICKYNFMLDRIIFLGFLEKNQILRIGLCSKAVSCKRSEGG